MHANCYSESRVSVKSTSPFEVEEIESLAGRIKYENTSAIFYRDYSMIWVHDGSGYICVGSETLNITADSIYCIKPGQAVRLQINGLGEGFFISFTKAFLDLPGQSSSAIIPDVFFDHLLMGGVIKLHSEPDDLMKNTAGKLLTEFRSCLEFKPVILKILLRLFIIYMSRGFKSIDLPVAATKHIALVREFNFLIDTHFRNKKMVREYATMLHVTPGYLNGIVRKISGFAASYHIRQRIILEARRRASLPGSNMKEIAHYLGFPDQAHFSKYFKNNSGQNFTGYKREVAAIG